MTTQPPPRSYTRLAIAIVVAVLIIGSVIYVTRSLGKTTSSSAPGVLTSCTIPDSGELLMKVLNSSDGEPISSLPIQVENYYPNCFSNNEGAVNTNGSGTILIGGIGDYNLTINYGQRSYFADTYIGPGTLTCVTLAIPSGDLDVSYSQPGEFDCETSTSTSSGSGSSSATSTGLSTITATIGTTTMPINSSSSSEPGGVVTTTIIITTTVNYPVGTTTTTQCSSTSAVTVTLMENGASQATTTVTSTATSTATNYGHTATQTGCVATTITTTVTQTG
jgi:hypothetical protein